MTEMKELRCIPCQDQKRSRVNLGGKAATLVFKDYRTCVPDDLQSKASIQTIIRFQPSNNDVTFESFPMTVGGVKVVAVARNGLGAFILPCRRMDFHYCDHWGSSKGMNQFLSSTLLPSITKTHPGCEFRVSPRPNHHPVIKAYYVNGREKAVCVRNMDLQKVMQRAQMLLQNDGAKNKRLGSKKVLSVNENVRGVWSPMHGGLKSI